MYRCVHIGLSVIRWSQSQCLHTVDHLVSEMSFLVCSFHCPPEFRVAQFCTSDILILSFNISPSLQAQTHSFHTNSFHSRLLHGSLANWIKLSVLVNLYMQFLVVFEILHCGIGVVYCQLSVPNISVFHIVLCYSDSFVCPIENGLWRVEWSRDRWRHMTLKDQGHDPLVSWLAIGLEAKMALSSIVQKCMKLQFLSRLLLIIQAVRASLYLSSRQAVRKINRCYCVIRCMRRRSQP